MNLNSRDRSVEWARRARVRRAFPLPDFFVGRQQVRKSNVTLKAANALIQAFKATIPESESDVVDITAACRRLRGSSGLTYRIDAAGIKAIRVAARRLQERTGTYPLERIEERLAEILVQLRERGTPLNSAHEELRTEMTDLVNQLTNVVSWDVLHAVRGVQPESEPFQVGAATFFHMGDVEFRQWGQRYTTGQSDPAVDAPILQSWIDSEGMLFGQVVAAAKVCAVDDVHAREVGRGAIEEAMDLMRYGQLVGGWPPEPVPEFGLAAMSAYGHVQRHSLMLRLDGSSTSTQKDVAAAQGAVLRYCQDAPAWNELNGLIRKPQSVRTEIECRIVLALTWIGQAATARTESVRLVCLMTALESLLISAHETIGKRRALAARVAGFPQIPTVNRRIDDPDVDRLYRIRSSCLHSGRGIVSVEDVRLACFAVAQVIHGLLCDAKFQSLSQLSEVTVVLGGAVPDS